MKKVLFSVLAFALVFVGALTVFAADKPQVKDGAIIFPESDVQPVKLEELQSFPAEGLPAEVAQIGKAVWGGQWSWLMRGSRSYGATAYLVPQSFNPETKEIAFVYTSGKGLSTPPLKFVIRGVFDPSSFDLKVTPPVSSTPPTYMLSLDRLTKRNIMELRFSVNPSTIDLQAVAEMPKAQ